jgi:threonine/homoserine/homoserine lactone efflux protein
MSPFFNGLIFGLLFIFAFGPAFFALLQTSLQHGQKSAVAMALGVSLSDIVYISLALLGISSLFDNPEVKYWVALLGGVLLVGYAVYSWNKKPVVETADEIDSGNLSLAKYFLKGLLLNGLNPFIIVFWMSIISIVGVKYDYSTTQQIYFFAGMVTTIFSMDILKVLLAQRIKHLVTPKIILVFNRSVGVVLFIFGLRILYFLIDNYWLQG